MVRKGVDKLPNFLDLELGCLGRQVSYCWSGEKFFIVMNLTCKEFSGGEFNWCLKPQSDEENVLGTSRGVWKRASSEKCLKSKA